MHASRVMRHSLNMLCDDLWRHSAVSFWDSVAFEGVLGFMASQSGVDPHIEAEPQTGLEGHSLEVCLNRVLTNSCRFPFSLSQLVDVQVALREESWRMQRPQGVSKEAAYKLVRALPFIGSLTPRELYLYCRCASELPFGLLPARRANTQRAFLEAASQTWWEPARPPPPLPCFPPHAHLPCHALSFVWLLEVLDEHGRWIGPGSFAEGSSLLGSR